MFLSTLVPYTNIFSRNYLLYSSFTNVKMASMISADANSTSNVKHTNIHSPDKKNGTRVELGCSPVPLTLSCLH